MTEKKILVIGDVRGAYRSQLLIKTLLDNRYTVASVGRKFYLPDRGSILSRFGPLKVISSLSSILLFASEFLIKYLFADVLYLLPMNANCLNVILPLKKFSSKKLISELYISLYATAEDRSWFSSEKSLKAKYFKYIDRLMLDKSDILIHLSAHELDHIAKTINFKNLDEKEIYILPLAIEPKRKAKPLDSDTFRICWWGSFIPLHGIDVVLKAFEILIKQWEGKISFDMFGRPGPKADHYINVIQELGITTNVHLHTDKTFANGQLGKYLEHYCDLALGHFGNSPKAKHCFPNKIVDAMAMGIPVLTMNAPSIKEFADPEKDLFICSNTAETIAETIINIIHDPEECRKRGERGYKIYQKIFSPEKYEKKIIDIIEHI